MELGHITFSYLKKTTEKQLISLSHLCHVQPCARLKETTPPSKCVQSPSAFRFYSLGTPSRFNPANKRGHRDVWRLQNTAILWMASNRSVARDGDIQCPFSMTVYCCQVRRDAQRVAASTNRRIRVAGGAGRIYDKFLSVSPLPSTKFRGTLKTWQNVFLL